MNRRVCLGIVLLTLLAVIGCGDSEKQTTNQESVAMTPVPLIDRELFFGDPEISGSQLSPDGQWMSFIKPYNGARNIWVKAAEEPFDAAKPVTADKRPVPGYFLSRDNEAWLITGKTYRVG